jgi:hypothetical protein
MSAHPTSSRGLFGWLGLFLAVWFRLVLAVFGALLMLLVVIAGLVLGGVMLLWGLLTGRKPEVVWFRRGPAGHAQGFGRDGRFGEAFRDPFGAFARRGGGAAAPAEVVDIEAREVPPEAPRGLPGERSRDLPPEG